MKKIIGAGEKGVQNYLMFATADDNIRDNVVIDTIKGCYYIESCDIHVPVSRVTAELVLRLMRDRKQIIKWETVSDDATEGLKRFAVALLDEQMIEVIRRIARSRQQV